ncbi:MAG: choice-of-anchor L domain-containing protein [Lewinellaceae bacterium]|nr:choice-of-anchor L domain-containing protein [Lewinellaceae bacterium]
MLKLPKLLSASVLLLTAFSLQAQVLEVTGANVPPFTPQNLITNVFLGDGVDVTNVTYNGVNTAVGYFTGGTNSIGLERGIILTSGTASLAADFGMSFSSVDNTSTATDPDLAATATSALNDVAVYSITFVPTSDTLRFRYCFGSEEYPEYACSPFNDVFGFFIQGPGYPTPTNIAKVPGTNLPVTINNVHPANPAYNCGPFNAQYYNDNNSTNLQPCYDGYTDVFTAEAIVVPCQQYTIKLAIADVSDGIFDSGVFLEAKSFGTSSIRVDIATPSLDGAVAEGCASGTLTFELPVPSTQDVAIDYNVWGTATNGVDYQTIPAGLIIPAGQTKLVIPIVAFEDNMTESPEYIAIDVQRDPCNRDTVLIYIRENNLLPPQLPLDTSLCLNGPAIELDATLPIPLPDPPSFSNTTDYSISPTNTAVVSTINVFGVQPPVLGANVFRSVCFNAIHPWVDDLDVYLISPGGQFVELTTDNGANGDNYTNTCFTPGATTIISDPGPFAPASSAPFTGDWLPEGPFSDLWDGSFPTNGLWKLQLIDDANGFNGTLLDWTITFEPSYKVNYQWFPIPGLSCRTCPLTNASPQQSTTYTVIATDSDGCEVSDSIYINIQNALLAPQVDCINSTVSSITFSWNNIPNSFGYEVNIDGTGWVPANGDTTHTVTGLIANSVVNIEVRGINGTLLCVPNVGVSSCSNCQSPALNAVVKSVSCTGSVDGQLTINTDNFNPPYAFALGAQNNSTGVFSGLAIGPYTVTVTDASGCSAQINASITAPNALSVSAATDQSVACFGGTEGQVSALGSGGTGNVNYLWSSPGNPTSPVVSNLPAGTYTVTVSDLNGCTSVASTIVSEPTEVLASLSQQNISCFGANNGEATVTGSGGSGTYTYLWSNGQTTPTATGLAPGPQSVTITDTNGCSKTAVTSILQPTLLQTLASSTATDCSGGSNGTATVIPSGGTMPYTYLWNNGQNSATINVLPSGTYTVTVTDNNNCTKVQNAVVSSPTPVAATLAPLNLQCNADNSGEVSASASGGNGNYSYLWSNGVSGSTVTGLPAGTITVTISDQLGCSTTAQTTLNEPTAISVTANSSTVSCYNSSNGTISLNPQGGTLPYVYLWNTGATTQNLSNLLPGNYTVTITDINNCKLTTQAIISAPPPISGTLTSSNLFCHGDNSGTITANIGGGTGTLTGVWTGPNGFSANGFNLSGLNGGTYNLLVTDVNGCTYTNTSILFEPSEMMLSLPLVSDTTCFSASDGQASVTASGGTAPYTYLWSVATQTGPSIANLNGGQYTVTVTDAANCMLSASTQILEREQVQVNLEGIDPHCHNGNNGQAVVRQVSYGSVAASINGFSFIWSTIPQQTGITAINLSPGQVYSVTATDASGCTGVQSLTLNNPDPIGAAITVQEDTKCFGAVDGTATATGVGGTLPYSYFWTASGGNQTTAQAINLSAGTYKVTVTDSRGCSATTVATINQPPALVLNLAAQAVPCFGDGDGSVMAQVTGGVSPYQFAWNNGASTAQINQLTAGVYLLTVTDAASCTHTAFVEVTQPQAPVGITATALSPRCFGASNGSISLLATGGAAPYRYSLNGGPSNGSPLQIGLKAGNYDVLVTDKNGCTTTLSNIEVPQPDAVLVDLGPDITVELGQGTQLDAIVQFAIEPVDYAWDLASHDLLSCVDCPDPYIDSIFFAHTFTLKIVDANGCAASDQIQVLVDKPRKIFVPTGFSPNDDLSNDKLIVHGQTSAKVLHFQVYDRWGEMVFQADNFTPNDASNGWDGNFRGKPMNPGVYVWVVEAQYMDGVTEVFKGNTTLIR